MKSSVKEPVYLDNHILVVNKSVGLPTQPRPSGGGSLEEDAISLSRLQSQIRCAIDQKNLSYARVEGRVKKDTFPLTKEKVILQIFPGNFMID